MEITLEREFAENVQLHKMAILTKKVSRFYFDKIIADGTNLSEEDVEKCSRIIAREGVRSLFLTDKQEFDRLYLLAWEELKHEID